MPTIRRAVIDVGTNSVKLLVADVIDGAVQAVLEESEQTRLGAGFFETNRLQPQPIELTANAVARYTVKARELGAVSVRVIATSAARDAVNAFDLTSAIHRAARLDVEIISGEQEADWAFQGVTTDPELAKTPLLIMDVGGGSTEFILGEGTQKYFRESFQLGTVRLLEKLTIADPPWPAELTAARETVKQFLGSQVVEKLKPALSRFQNDAGAPPVQLVGTGGTASIIARMYGQFDSYERTLIEGMRIGVADIQAQTEKLWSLPLLERKKTPGLPKNRADVILAGMVIYEGVMERLGFSELRVTTRGLRFAALMNA